tara:strand:+ start:487 stop:723 length:237 start_codon:yes stop_codon:yes gene_type:complete
MIKKLSLVCLLLSTTMVAANDKTKIINLNNEIIFQKNKLINHLKNEKIRSIQFQKNNWKNSKIQWTKDWEKIKNYFVK